MKSLEQLQLEHPKVFDTAILTAYRGLHLHGTYIPNKEDSSIDDVDLMNVCIPNKSYYFGLETFGSRDTAELKDGPWDVVSYEIRKFVRLLMKGNPNVIGILYLQPEHYLRKTSEADALIKYRHLFNSQAVYYSFLGYSNAQFYKMTHLAFKGYMGDKRKKLVEKFGYDCKNAAHLIRLMRMCNEWLVTKSFNVFRTVDAQQLIDIKTGKWSLDEVKAEAARLFAQGEQLFNEYKDSIPREPDTQLINDLLLEIFGVR